jgi:hemolysin activation/secretion protein
VFLVLSQSLLVVPLPAIAQTQPPQTIGQTTSQTTSQTPPSGPIAPPEAPDPTEQTLPNPLPLPEIPPGSPPVPQLQTPNPAPTLQVPERPDIRFRVVQIEVLGNTVLQEEINQLIQPFAGQAVTFDQLIELRSQITQLYIDNGYITSGAFLLNNQDLSDGIIQIQVVEGRLEAIAIDGLDRLRPGYVRSRIRLADSIPLRVQDLERALQLLQLDPLIEQVNAELTAGSAPGLNVLQLSLREAPAFHAGIRMDNYQSTSIGSLQGSVFASYDNVTGWGDRINVQYGLTEGLDLYDVSYSLPVNPREGTLRVRYSNNNSNIVTEEFEELGIRSEAETLSVGFRQPLTRSPNQEFALGLGVDVRHSQTYILDDRPFSFSEGAENGESRATVIRFSQEWVDRGPQEVIALRSQLSLGIDALDATVNDAGTDGRFVAWLGQFQYVKRLSRNVLVTRLNAQLTPDSLLSFERFSIGGVESVRGYPQNQLVADNGVFGSVELRIPLEKGDRLQIIPFVEAGHGWNNRTADSADDFLLGAGLGVRWQPTPELDVRLDYGLPLIDVADQGDSLQDNGLYFSLRYQPF